ncbi:KamA family radical SAM protein [Streptoverticillium reticulum]|uniref:KamA family radical SAM protein n=1 Tax=Streptoverticillium reticulum TaxID=1433415 RepID=UPI0039BFBD52
MAIGVQNGASARHPRWADVPEAEWSDPRWQMTHRLRSASQLREVMKLTEEEEGALGADGLFRVDVTPYFLSLIDGSDPQCPLRRQVIPTSREMEAFDGRLPDANSEIENEPVRGVIHKYPDRLVMLVTSSCAAYCRYCTRSRFVGDGQQNYGHADWQEQIRYVRESPQVRDVLISGGDPLTMARKRLAEIVAEIREIPHVEIIRLGTRAPVFNPFVVDDELCEIIEANHPMWVNIHVNHPYEITPELGRACDRLLRAGAPVGSQAVLLKGINDSVEVQRRLCTELVRIRVRPYYLYQCDSVRGAGHFRTSVTKGIEIIEGLRGHITGFAVPTYVIDSPGGGGKIPVAPNYLLSLSPERAVLRNWAGEISEYKGPSGYRSGTTPPLRGTKPPAPRTAPDVTTVSDRLSAPQPSDDDEGADA